MKIKITFFCFLLLQLGSKAQQLSCDKLENYPQISFAKYFSARQEFFFMGDTMFLFRELKASIFRPGQAAREIDLLSLLNAEQQASIKKVYEFSYYLKDHRLVVKNHNNVFLFRFEKDKFLLEEHILLQQKYGRDIYFNSNQLYFYEIYDHSRSGAEMSAGYQVYDLSSRKERVHTFPFTCLGITHLGPNKFMDFTNKSYVVCDPLKYKIYEYDLNDQLKDSLQAPDSLFKGSDPAQFNKQFDPEKMGSSVSSHLESMRTYLDTLDRVWLINYIDENTLFVRMTRNSQRSSTRKGQLFYDHIWARTAKGWKVTQVKDLSTLDEEKQITKNEIWPYFFPGSKYICVNGIFYYTCWSSSPNTFPQSLKQFSGFSATDRNSISLKVIQFKIK